MHFQRRKNGKGNFQTILVKMFAEFFHTLAQILFARSETELDDYHQKVNAQVTERLQTDFRILRKFQENR